jgi:oligosaccharide repeat unit polymerase
MYSLLDLRMYKRTIINALIFSGFIMGTVTFTLYKEVLLMGIGRLNMLQYSTGEETISPLALSYAGSLTIALCFYEILFRKNKKYTYNLYLSITLILSFVMFLLGASRGSVIAFFLSIIPLFYYGTIKNKFKFIISIGLSIPLVIWGLIASDSNIVSRSSSTFNGEQIENRSGSRLDLWNVALEIFAENPFWGESIEIINAPGYIGIGNGNMYPHNILLETLMSTGIIGFILLLLFLVPGFRNTLKISNKIPQFVWIAVLLIQGLSQAMFSGALYFSVLVFFPLGLIYNFQIKRSKLMV